MSDEKLFRSAMREVKQIVRPEKVTPVPGQSKPVRKHIRKRHVIEEQALPSTAGPEWTGEPWVLKADGVSSERLRRLAAGRPPIHIKLDLHGMTRDESLSALTSCLQQAWEEGERAVCIVHGRGLHSRGRPVLKEAVYQWLQAGPQASQVLAVIPKPGTGGGSCLVLLRRKGRRMQGG